MLHSFVCCLFVSVLWWQFGASLSSISRDIHNRRPICKRERRQETLTTRSAKQTAKLSQNNVAKILESASNLASDMFEETIKHLVKKIVSLSTLRRKIWHIISILTCHNILVTIGLASKQSIGPRSLSTNLSPRSLDEVKRSRPPQGHQLTVLVQ